MKWRVAGWIGLALPFVAAHAQAQSALPLLAPREPAPPAPAPSTLERNGLVLGASVGAAYMNALGYSYEARAGWGFADPVEYSKTEDCCSFSVACPAVDPAERETVLQSP